MVRLIVVIMVSAAFLCGYHLGRQPNSPDIIGMGRHVYDKTAEIIAKADSQNKRGPKSPGEPNMTEPVAARGEMPVEIDLRIPSGR